MSKLNPEARDFATPRNFARLLNCVPAKKRREIAAEHGYDFNARHLWFDAHLRAWVLFGLTDGQTVRDMHAAVNEDPLHRLNGAGIDISVGGLSPDTLQQIAELLEQAVLFDSTTLHLPDKIKARAEQHAGEELPLKVHLRLHSGYGGIDRLILTTEHENDARRYKELLDLDQAQEGGKSLREAIEHY